MIDQSLLTRDLKRVLTTVEDDIRARCDDTPEVDVRLRARYEAARTANRTAQPYPTWREGEITQAGVAWLLGCVFVRFLEDNRLIDDAWIVAPGQQENPKERIEHAQNHYLATHRAGLHIDDRAYLALVFTEVARLPGVAELFDQRHNPLWHLGPSGIGARRILDFFRRIDPDTNTLIHDFTDSAENTGFLGDIYQNVSESARKRYALLQTPSFVVDFMLDRTLTPALDEFGLPSLRLIDPTCGSGHFLLAAFERLFAQWTSLEPATDFSVLADRALNAVYGVDVNPYAVAIARFRLLIAAVRACGIQKLTDAPDWHFNVTTGDSLLFGPQGLNPHISNLTTEDPEAIHRILRSQSYHVVVGNPPYINVQDPGLRAKYRRLYASCSGKYQISVPFTECFFDLTLNDDGSGYTGMITSNAFMYKSFGKDLIEKHLQKWDLTHVIDTSGVHLAGFGTPTVIIFGRNRPQVRSVLRVVRGIRGEMVAPIDVSNAPVWTEIRDNVDQPGFCGQYVSVDDAQTDVFHHHPWSIGGGGAAELKQRLDEVAESILEAESSDCGVFGMTNADDIMIAPRQAFGRAGVETSFVRPMILGEGIKDWSVHVEQSVLFPYVSALVPLNLCPALHRWVWIGRTTLGNRATFNQSTYFAEGRPWWAWHQIALDRLNPEATITFPFVATHNHFVLERGGRVFKQTSPIVKLGRNASEAEHVELLGLLNSSTCCFWLRQVCRNKGTGGIGGGLATEKWEQFFEFDSTNVASIPVPIDRPTEVALAIQAAADERAGELPARFVKAGIPTRKGLDDAHQRATRLLYRMIALQEELDWQVYQLFSLTEQPLTIPIEQVPEVELGQRAFEIVMARAMRDGDIETTWFQRHGSTPITEIPVRWPEPYRAVVQLRIDLIARDRDIALIEQPEYKRRWNLPTWEQQEKAALQSSLLDRLEAPSLWPVEEPTLRTVAQLAHEASHDPDFAQVAAQYLQREAIDFVDLVRQLVMEESVPFLPAFRYKQSGLDKRKQWEETWALQRREDAGEKVEILPAPKYGKEDFLPGPCWALRGKLDVPKERWILYPHLERGTDRTPVLGWAGYDHAQQARALAGYYHLVRSEEGWERDRLIPILAGLQELMPWLRQWHPGEIAEVIGEMLRGEMAEFGLTEADLREWRPASPTGKSPTKKRAKKQS